MADHLEFKREGETVHVVVARGSGNRFTTEMTQALADAVAAFEDEPGMRFLRLRGAGDVFCLGRDQEGTTPDEVRLISTRIVHVHEVLRETSLVVICEVSGDAAGFGVGLVASSDVAIASEDASFWFPELEAGLAPAVVLSWLGRLLPSKQAFDLVSTGRRMTAAEALRCGLLTEIVAPGDIVGAADRWVELLSSLDYRALRDVKEFLRRAAAMDERAAGRSAADLLALGSLRLQRPS